MKKKKLNMNWPRALRGIAAPALMPICVFLWKYKFLIYYIVWEICLAVCTRARMLLHRRRRCPPIRSRKTMVLNINWFPCNHFLFSISQTYIYILYSCVVPIRRHSFGGRTAVRQPAAAASNNSHWINLFAADHSSSHFVCRFNSKMCEQHVNGLRRSHRKSCCLSTERQHA